MNRLLKLAAVDDLQSEQELLAEKLKDYMQARWLKYELFEYESGEVFPQFFLLNPPFPSPRSYPPRRAGR